MQKYIHKETKEIIEAEQVKQPKDHDEKTSGEYLEKHGDLWIPDGYWKIFRDGAPRQTAPNDHLFKKMYAPHKEKPEAQAKS